MEQIVPLVTDLYEKVQNSNFVQMFNYFTEKYIVSQLLKTNFTSHLVQHLPSKIITLLMIYAGILLAIYETILNTGVYFDLWTHPADAVFEEIPVHCAHVYVSVNIMMASNDEEEDEINNEKDTKKGKKLLLKYPIVYHFEFSPEEYAHEDYGTDLKFLRQKVHNWFMDSQVYYLNKDNLKKNITLKDVELYNKKGKILNREDAYLCDLDVNTGETVFCVIQGSD